MGRICSLYTKTVSSSSLYNLVTLRSRAPQWFLSRNCNKRVRSHRSHSHTGVFIYLFFFFIGHTPKQDHFRERKNIIYVLCIRNGCIYTRRPYGRVANDLHFTIATTGVVYLYIPGVV